MNLTSNQPVDVNVQNKATVLEIKDFEQKKALGLWKKNKFKGSVIAGTGFGKGRVGCLAIGEILLRYEGRGLFLVPTTQLQDQAKDEFIKWGYEELLDRIDIVCYQSAYKYVGKEYTVTVADEVHIGLSPQYRAIFTNNIHHRLLCMTATLPEEAEYKTFLVNLAPPVYVITLDECVVKGLVAPYKITCIPVRLTPEEKEAYMAANKLFVYYKYQLGQFQAFDEANRILADSNASPLEKKNAAMFYKAIRDRKEVVQKAANKINATVEIVKNFPDKKILTFAGTNDFTNEMYSGINKELDGAARRYHSALGKGEKVTALADFKSGKASVLCSTKALNQGFDVPDAQLGIICGLDSKALQMIQRVGRLLRLSPNKTGEVVIFYVADSQEEKWLRNSIRNLSNVVWMNDISSYI